MVNPEKNKTLTEQEEIDAEAEGGLGGVEAELKHFSEESIERQAKDIERLKIELAEKEAHLDYCKRSRQISLKALEKIKKGE